MSDSARTVGIIGVGEIGAAIAGALATGAAADQLDITLSPRSRKRVRELEHRHTRIHIASCNQDVVDCADILLLTVLPDQVEPLCQELAFRPGQVVVGVAAGWPPSRLGPLVAPATQVCQLIPLPMIALRTGPVVLFPAIEPVQRLFADCGTVITPAAEDEIPALSCASATMSSFFVLQRTVVEWVARQGLTDEIAKHYVTSLFSGLSAEAAAAGPTEWPRLVTSHETPGGFNLQLREALESRGLFDAVASGLDDLAARLRRG